MPEAFELLYAASCLFIRVIPCSDGSHTRGLVSSIALRAVVEVGVWSARAIHAYIPRHRDMRASVRHAHDGHDGDLNQRSVRVETRREPTYTTGRTDRSCLQLWQKRFLVFIWDRADDVHKPGNSSKAILLAHLRSQLVERHRLVCIVCLDQFCGNTRGNTEERFRLRWAYRPMVRLSTRYGAARRTFGFGPLHHLVKIGG